MAERLVLLSIPQVRRRDVTPGGMSSLDRVAALGGVVELQPVFPSVSATAFATLVTGAEPTTHGIVAGAFLDREQRRVVGPFLSDSDVGGEKIWEWVARDVANATTLAWFTPNTADAQVDIWAGLDEQGSLRTKPDHLAAELVQRFGPFPTPLGGPAASAPRLETTAWALRAAAFVLESMQPTLAVIRVPHLGHVARRHGPDGRDAARAIRDLDRILGPFLASTVKSAIVIAATETIATPVDGPIDINRALRQLGALRISNGPFGTDLDLESSLAVAVPDHQVCHVYVSRREAIPELAVALAGNLGAGIDVVLQGASRQLVGLGHPRAGDLVLVSEPDRWFRADWWLKPEEAPKGPCPSGLDPASLHVVSDPARVQGSMGAPPTSADDMGMVVVSRGGLIGEQDPLQLVDISKLVRRALAP